MFNNYFGLQVENVRNRFRFEDIEKLLTGEL